MRARCPLPGPAGFDSEPALAYALQALHQESVLRTFNRCSSPGWYALGKAPAAGSLRSVQVAGHSLVLWRSDQGLSVLDARCPHLGADLGGGEVVSGVLRCPFHHWTFDAEGRCSQGRGTRSYAVVERFGQVWTWLGGTPSHLLPAEPPGFRALVARPRQMRSGAHLTLGNGLDPVHFDTFHGFALEGWSYEQEGHRVALELRGRPRAAWLRVLTGTRRQTMFARFQTFGGTLAMASVLEPRPFHCLFNVQHVEGGCINGVTFLVPPGALHLARCAATVFSLVRDDRALLERVDFRPAFVETDAAFAAFHAVVEELGPLRGPDP